MQRMFVALILLAFIGGGGLLVYQTLSEEEIEDFSANLISVDDIELPSTGFAAVEGDYDWQFPDDYAPHSGFQREQWQLSTADGCAVRLDVVFERITLVPDAFIEDTGSSWRVNDTVLAQATLQTAGDLVLEAQRAERQTLELAGVSATQVFVDSWTLDFAEERLVLYHDDLRLDAEFTFIADGQPQSTDDQWYSYTRQGVLEAETNNTAVPDFACDMTLTHRFGSG